MEALHDVYGSLLPHGYSRLPFLSSMYSPVPKNHPHGLTSVKESAGKTLEEMDFLFTKDRTIWVFRDLEAKKIGAIFERDMTHGQALTAFDTGKEIGLTQVESVPVV